MPHMETHAHTQQTHTHSKHTWTEIKSAKVLTEEQQLKKVRKSIVVLDVVTTGRTHAHIHITI
jgi:hypothetical protein